MAQKAAHACALVKRCVRKWLDDGAFELAAALAYYTLTSLAPMLLIAIMIASAVFGEEAARGQVARQVQRVAGPEGAGVVESMIDSTRKSGGTGWAAAISIAVILLGATGVFAEIKTALNRIWGVAKAQRKGGTWNFIKRRLLAFLLVLAVGVLLLGLTLAAAAASAAASFLPDLAVSSRLLLLVGDALVSIAVMVVLFAAMYRLLPDCVIAGRDVWTGALVTATLFELGILGIGAYMARSAVASTYGAAGSVIVILLGIYYSALIFLLGAEFTNVYATSNESRGNERDPAARDRGSEAWVAGVRAQPTATQRQEVKSDPREATNSADRHRNRHWARVGIATVAGLALGTMALKGRLSRLAAPR